MKTLLLCLLSGTVLAQGMGTLQGNNTGDVTLASFGASPNANGLLLSGQVLTLEPASATQPGGVSTTTQSWAGDKTTVGATADYGHTSTALATPGNAAFSSAHGGGTLLHSTAYYARISATNAQGETLASTETSTTTGTGADDYTVTYNWAAVTGATGYNVYARTTGAETKAGSTTAGVLTFADTGGALSGALPAANTTGRVVGGAGVLTSLTTNGGGTELAVGANGTAGGTFGVGANNANYLKFAGATSGSASVIGLDQSSADTNPNLLIQGKGTGQVRLGGGQNYVAFIGNQTAGSAIVISNICNDAACNFRLSPTGGAVGMPSVATASLLTCTASTWSATQVGAGGVNYDSTKNQFAYCNGTSWLYPVASSDWTLNVYDAVTLVGTTGNIYQVGPITNAGTLRDITFVAPIAGGGTGTETIKLSTASGCGSAVLGTLSIACNGAAGAITTGTVNSAALAAASTVWVCITAACTTADIQGNISAHFTTP